MFQSTNPIMFVLLPDESGGNGGCNSWEEDQSLSYCKVVLMLKMMRLDPAWGSQNREYIYFDSSRFSIFYVKECHLDLLISKTEKELLCMDEMK